MCGIAGIWGDAEPAAIRSMVAAMHHRGPDDHGVYSDPQVSLGCTRLAVIDLTSHGHQPMANHSETVWIAYNGEIYNFQEERRLLEQDGYVFESDTDTEVVLHLYEKYGDDFLLRLRGMFALAIYDRRKGRGRERLLLARDHLGIKPLVYTRTNGRLVFASELKALLASGFVRPELDLDALRMLLTFGSVYQPQTMLAGISALLPAHRLVVEGGTSRVERWWSLGTGRRPELAGLGYDELVEVVHDELMESIRRELVADVPVGAFLSGGFDSSLLVALMVQQARGDVRTFSVGFSPAGHAIDESGEATRIAGRLGAEHSNVVIGGDDVHDRIEHIVEALDQPSVDGVNTYFVSRAARESATVALSGTGGDELFAGYPWFLEMLAPGEPDGAPRRFVSRIAQTGLFDPFVAGRGGPTLDRVRNVSDGFVGRFARTNQIFGPVVAARLLRRSLRHDARAGRSPASDVAPLDELCEASVINRVSALCLRGYTANQLLRDIDATSMAHSLEVRVPYLDRALADMAFSLPEAAKVRRNGSHDGTSTYRESGAKRILIDAARRYLPRGFDDRKKRGFAMPFDAWLRGPLAGVLEDTLSQDAVRSRGLLDVREVTHVRDAFVSGAVDWSKPWLLMIFELWCRSIIDKPQPASLDVAA